MAKNRYTDEDKAKGHLALQVNAGNVLRSSRDTGIPEATLRDWKKSWEKDGVPIEILEYAEQFASDFVEDATRVRDLALAELEKAIRSGDLKSEKLITVVGVLEDKIRLGKGLATSRHETVQKLPDASELREVLGGYIAETMRDAAQREDDINEVEDEIIPIRELQAKTGG